MKEQSEMMLYKQKVSENETETDVWCQIFRYCVVAAKIERGDNADTELESVAGLVTVTDVTEEIIPPCAVAGHAIILDLVIGDAVVVAYKLGVPSVILFGVIAKVQTEAEFQPRPTR